MRFKLERVRFINGEQFYNKIHFIFNVVVAIPLIPFAIVYLESQKNQDKSPLVSEDVAMILQFTLPIMAAITSYFAITLYRKHLQTAPDLANLRDKLVLYFNAAIWKYATLEIAMLLTVAGFYLTYASVFIIVFVILLVVFSLGRPTIRKLVVDLKLSKQEEKIMIDKEEIA